MNESFESGFNIPLMTVHIGSLVIQEAPVMFLDDSEDSLLISSFLDGKELNISLKKADIKSVKENYDEGQLEIQLKHSAVLKMNEYLRDFGRSIEVDDPSKHFAEIKLKDLNERESKRLKNFFSNETPDNNFAGSSPLRLSNSHNESTTEDQTVVVRQVQRRSIRISKMKEIRQSKEKSVPKIKEKVRKSRIKNKIVASYLNSTVDLNITKKDHKSAVLELMNTGSCKEIQVLPCLGAKKAFCIVSHRAVNGKFKNFEQVKKALGMTPKLWNTFAEKNLLK